MVCRREPVVFGTRRQGRLIALALGLVAGAFGYYTIDRRDVAEVTWRAVRGTRFEKDFIRWHLTGSKDATVRALADRRINAGDRVDEVIAALGPFHVETFGPYQSLSDVERAGGPTFEGYSIVAKNGRLVAAGWFTCVGGITFFDTTTPAEGTEYQTLRDAERDRQHKERWAGVMAVGGPLGVVALWEPLPRDDQP